MRRWWGEQYDYFMDCFCQAQRDFAKLPPQEQPEHLGIDSGACMHQMLLYAYQHLDEFKLLLCGAEGTRFSHFIDEMVGIELQGTHDYLKVLADLWGRPAPPIDERLEHILITGMFNAFFELILHEMPLERAGALPGGDARLLHGRMDENYGAVSPIIFTYRLVLTN